RREPGARRFPEATRAEFSRRCRAERRCSNAVTDQPCLRATAKTDLPKGNDRGRLALSSRAARLFRAEFTNGDRGRKSERASSLAGRRRLSQRITAMGGVRVAFQYVSRSMV